MRSWQMAAVAVASASGGIALAQATGVEPGRWDLVSTVTSATMPGAPPMVTRSMVGRTTRASRCLTPQDAASGPRTLLKPDGGACTIDSYSFTAGRFNSEMTCRQAGATMTTRTAGTTTPTSFAGTTIMTVTGAGGMTVTTSASARRVGPCG